MIKVGIIGASGYAGGELLRLLMCHPNVHVACAVSNTYSGKPLAAAFPGLARFRSLCFSDMDVNLLSDCDVVFLAQENGKAMHLAPKLLSAGCKVVDISADYRFRDPATYEKWYGVAHASPEWNREAVYGLPELYRAQIVGARLVANPGCYPTAAILALAPLLRAKLIEPNTIVIDAKSGASGAGRSKFALSYHFSELNENVSAYKIAGTHRHTPEIEAVLADLAGVTSLHLTFTPHLIPITRGILATCYANLVAPKTTQQLQELYKEFYKESPFVTVFTEGLPSTKGTYGSNDCHIAVAVDDRTDRVTVVSAIDNLVKGAAGQAIQNMNLLCGLPETAGLEHGGLWP